MKEVKYGVVSVVLPGSVNLPEKSGKMSKKEVSRLLKAPHGMALAAEHSASALEKLGASFTTPAGITPESLRASGAESQKMEQVINDLLVVLSKLKQGKLLIDHKTHLQLRRLKDQVRTEAKYNPELKILFGLLLEWFEKPSETRKENQARSRRVLVSTQQAPGEAAEKPSLNLVTLPEVAS